MHTLMVSGVCFLLMMSVLTSTGTVRSKCPKCPPGFYKIKDCSLREGSGIQCAKCTKCSAALQDTLVPCSAYADSVCVSRPTKMVPTIMASHTDTSPDESSHLWIIVTAVSVSVFLVLLSVLFFIWWSCTNRWKFMKLPPTVTCSPEKKDPPLPETLLQVSTSPT